VEGAGVEGLVEVGIGEAVEGQLQLGISGRSVRFSGSSSPSGPEEAVGVDQLQDADLLLIHAGGHDGAHRAPLRHIGEGVDDRVVGNVAALAGTFCSESK
jgi:hypothetical protein